MEISMKTPKKSSLVVLTDAKPLYGTAAQLAHISRMGGWDAFLGQVAQQVITDFVASYNQRALAQQTTFAAFTLISAESEVSHVRH
jgi:hypothetical protein